MDRKEIDQKLEDISARMTSSKVFNSEEDIDKFMELSKELL